MIYAISWLVAVFLHINTLKRTSLYNTKEKVVDEIYELLDAFKEEEELLVKENTFSHKFSRIENKVNELNSIYRKKLIDLDHETISAIFTLDVAGPQHEITQVCYDAVEYVDKQFHDTVQSAFSIFYLNRYELAGILSSSASIYFIVQLVEWLFTGEI